MAVKILMKRVPNPGSWRELNSRLQELRILAMSQPGYISGETMLSATDQGTTLVISTWDHVNNWKAYEDSAERRNILDRLESSLVEASTTEVWIESPVIG